VSTHAHLQGPAPGHGVAGMAAMAVKAARMLWAWAACRPVGRPRWIVVIAATAIPLNLLFSLPHIRASSTRFEKPFLHCRTSPPQFRAHDNHRLHHHHAHLALCSSWPLGHSLPVLAHHRRGTARPPAPLRPCVLRRCSCALGPATAARFALPFSDLQPSLRPVSIGDTSPATAHLPHHHTHAHTHHQPPSALLPRRRPRLPRYVAPVHDGVVSAPRCSLGAILLD
jgi:hypothetical protein